MSIWLRALLCGAFLLAQVGYILFFIKKKLPPAFAPIALIVGQTLFLYLSGFCNGMRAGQILLLVAGVLLLAVSFRKDTVTAVLRSPGIWLFLAFAGFAFLLAYPERLAHWDDYSHWGRIAKALTGANGFPTQAGNDDITYITYAPGMAVWVCFVGRFVRFGQGEGVWIWAHNLISLACVTAVLFPFERLIAKRGFAAKATAIGITLVSTFFLFSFNGQNFSLLVDGTIALLCAAAVAVLFAEDGKSPICLWTAALIACTIPLFKSSGLLFSMLFAVCFAVTARGCAGTGTRKRLLGAVCFLLPFLLWGVWQLFARIRWEDVAGSEQAVSAVRFGTLFAEKAATGRVTDILDIYWKAVLGGSGSHIVAFWLGMLGALLLCVTVSGKGGGKMKPYAKMLGVLLLGGAVYLVALACTYLFSMGENEALTLASFNRYLNTYSVLMLAILIHVAAVLLDGYDGKALFVPTVCFVLVPILLLTGFCGAWSAYDFKNASLTQNERYNDLAIRTLSTGVSEEMQRNPAVDYAVLIVDRAKTEENSPVQYPEYWRYMLSYQIRIPRRNTVFVRSDEIADTDVFAYQNKPRTIAVVVGKCEKASAFIDGLGLPVYRCE